MLPIFICEDDPTQRKRLEQYINNYIVIENLDMEIVLSTDNPAILLNHLENHPELAGLYFLDVDLGHEIDGISLAVHIRRLDFMGSIVFITTHSGLAPSIFKHKVEALDYIIKDAEPKKIQQGVVDCLQNMHQRYSSAKPVEEKFFKIQNAGKLHLFPLDEILFFETSTLQKKLVVHLENGDLLFTGKVKEIEEANPLFIRIHKSVVANKNNIRSVNSKEMFVEFSNGDKRPISPKGLKLIKEALSLREEGR